MIYVKENDTTVKIPRHFRELLFEENVNVIITSGKNVYTLVEPVNVEITLENFYVLPITNLPENVGEYEYRLFRGDELLETGLLVYGDYKKPEKKSINNPEKDIQLK